MSHSRESKCILGIAAICEVSKPRCSVFGELSFSFASKWYVLVLKSAIVNCMIEKVKTSPRRRDMFRSCTWKKKDKITPRTSMLCWASETETWNVLWRKTWLCIGSLVCGKAIGSERAHLSNQLRTGESTSSELAPGSCWWKGVIEGWRCSATHRRPEEMLSFTLKAGGDAQLHTTPLSVTKWM